MMICRFCSEGNEAVMCRKCAGDIQDQVVRYCASLSRLKEELLYFAVRTIRKDDLARLIDQSIGRVRAAEAAEEEE